MRTSLRGPCHGAFIHQVERLFRHGTAVGLSEGELLERFVAAGDERAFEALMARHGPMVLGVCRRLLRDPNDVNDAFQATFLVLVRKAGSLRRCDLLGNWLYGVARKVAKRAQILAARRLARTTRGPDLVDQRDAGHRLRNGDDPSMHDPESAPWLHEEVRRLPEKYRTVVLLCYFEGLTYEGAAARLGCPIGTIKGRLARARDLLRKRLLRRGVVVSAAAMDWHLALPDLRVAVPEPLKYATLKAALLIIRTSGGSIVGTSSVSLSVANLTDGVLQAMNPINLKAVSLVFLVAGAVTTSLVVAAAQGPAQPDEPDDQPPAAGAAGEQLTEVIAQKKVAERQTAKAKRQATVPRKAMEKTGTAIGGQAPAGGAGGMMGMGMGMGGGMGGMSGGFAGPMGGGGFDEGSFDGGSGEDFRGVRRNNAELSAAMMVWDKTPGNEEVLKGLNQPLKMSFAKPTPLDEVLKYIKSAKSHDGSAIPIYVDPVALEEAQVKMDSKVIIDLEGVPLKTSLRLILKQLALAYCVRDGVLIISTDDGIHQELAEAARELMGSGKMDQIDPRTLRRTGVLKPLMGGMGGMSGTGGMSGGMGGGGMGMM
jgi:RNA polymerase sigma factor (sigma-70 family)